MVADSASVAGFKLLQEVVAELQRRRRGTQSAGVKPQMQRRAAFDERKLGYSSFAEFVAAAELAGWIVRERTPSGHTLLKLPDMDGDSSATPAAQAPPSGRRRLRSDLWRAFIGWHGDVIRVYDRERQRALILNEDSADDPPGLAAVREALKSGDSSVVPIEPISRDEQGGWMRDFADRHQDHPLGEGMRRALESSRPFQAFSRILEADSELQAKFREHRLGNVTAAALRWMDDNGLSIPLWEGESSAASSTRPATQSGDAEIDRLRSIVHSAVDRMSADELKSLSLPLRYIADPPR